MVYPILIELEVRLIFVHRNNCINIQVYVSIVKF